MLTWGIFAPILCATLPSKFGYETPLEFLGGLNVGNVIRTDGILVTRLAEVKALTLDVCSDTAAKESCFLDSFILD